jgi:hypothetical protein
MNSSTLSPLRRASRNARFATSRASPDRSARTLGATNVPCPRLTWMTPSRFSSRLKDRPRIHHELGRQLTNRRKGVFGAQGAEDERTPHFLQDLEVQRPRIAGMRGGRPD